MTYQEEKGFVRDLAKKVADIANDERMTAIKKRWCDVNALRKPDRAPIWCKPVACWGEMLSDDAIKCEDPFLRGFEYRFRQILIKREIDDDEPVESYLEVPAVFDVEPANVWGIEPVHHHSGEDGGAWAYEPVIRTMNDLEKLKMPEFRYNEEKTQEKAVRIDDLMGDILPARISKSPGFGIGTMGNTIADFMGMSEMMLLMMTDPDLVHQVSAHIRDGVMKRLDVMEASGDLTLNNTGPMLCSDPFGPEPVDGQYAYKNLWCAANSQEYDQVSPAMWEEFCLAYQKPIFARFGQVCYGCCENLTQKIDGVLSIPNLRIFVCSAWTDLGKVIERVGNDYCIMWRQKASDVVCPDDVESIRGKMEKDAAKLQGHCYQIVLRELQTLYGHPNRLHEFVKMAKGIAEKYA